MNKKKLSSVIDLSSKRSTYYLKENDVIHCLNISLLRHYIDGNNRIKHRRFTSNTRQQHTAMTRSVKQARSMGLLPYKH